MKQTNYIKENGMKKKLSDKDIALLVSRGINGFTTTINNTKNVKKLKKCKSKETNLLIGKVLHTSWGYDMTINEFCKIISVSPTGKTAKCRMLNKEGFNGFQGPVSVGNKMYGPEFRLKIDSETSFHGSYPYCISDTKEKCSFHMGYFHIHHGGTVHENHMD